MSTRPRPRRSRTLTIFSMVPAAVLALGLFSSCAAASAAPAAPRAPPSSKQSPSAESPDLICHTDNPAECYPRIFSPTTEFQVVRDDQDLPPGLHVQLDMQTGRKVAKINDPSEKSDPSLEGLPVDHAVVLVDQPAGGDEDDDVPAVPRRPAGAPAYEPVGAIKEPREKHDGFANSLRIVKDHVSLPDGVEVGTLVPALADLEELAHDMYYGLKIAEDRDILQALFCILLERDMDAWLVATEQHAGAKPGAMDERPDFLASMTLAAAIRNNPPGLTALEKSWDAIMGSSCRLQSGYSLKAALYDNLAPSSPPSSSSSTAQSRFESDQARLTLAVLRGLLRSAKIRDEFLNADGMRSLLRILLSRDEAWSGARKGKVARIVADTFLDADAGAVAGVWGPTASGSHGRADEGACAAMEAELEDEALGDGALFVADDGTCWEYHLEKVLRDGRGGDWAQDLLALFQDLRPQESGSSSGRQEL
ncbi:nucleotide exchange factor SIL1 [Microdochium nivale]|nr:nucleotide exchange factor SIL1 [Microdochium nivale]